MEHSRKWRFPLAEITVLNKERYSLRFQRHPIIAHVLNSVLTLRGDYGRSANNNQSRTICLQLQAVVGAVDGGQDLRHYRLQQLYKILLRLVDYSSWRLVEPNDRQKDTICVTVELEKCCNGKQPVEHVCLTCGPVLEPINKGASSLTVDEYLKLRCQHMELMATQRSGMCPVPMSSLDTLTKRLAAAAVIVDLFVVRHSSAVSVVRNGVGICKGASYILYNSARLEALLRKFNYEVNNCAYEKLPLLDEIDLSVLEDDVDWELIYGYLLTFPELMESIMDQLDQGHCGLHLLVHYVENLAAAFSRFYYHKKVLLQKRDELMPILYARIYLIKAVRQVLNTALAVLGIEPVDYV
nr:AT12688p [Drosophila melanogaster]